MLPFQNNSQIVAAVQYEPQLLNVLHNIKVAKQLAFEAAVKGAKLIVLPELAMSGFVINSTREAADVSQTSGGYQTQAMTEIAERFNCHIVFGYVELCEGKLYNSAAVVGPCGLEGNVRKHNLLGSDNLWAQPSDEMFPVILTPCGRLGVLICRDILNNYRESYQFYKPSHRFYRKGDVDVIALPTNWGSGFSFPDSSWVELVESTRANVIVANRVGEERDMSYKGGSCIITRDRRIWSNGSNFDGEAVVGGLIEV